MQLLYDTSRNIREKRHWNTFVNMNPNTFLYPNTHVEDCMTELWSQRHIWYIYLQVKMLRIKCLLNDVGKVMFATYIT